MEENAGDLNSLRAVYHRRNRTLAEFGRDALQDIDTKALLDQAVLRVAQAVDISHSKIMQYRAETADLLVVAGHGWHEGVVGHRVLRSDIASPAGCAFQTAQPVSVDDIRQAPHFRIPSLLSEHGIVALSNVPILVDGQVWGVLEVDEQHPRHLTSEDTDFLHGFASFLGAAIRRKQIEAETRQLSAAQGTAAQQMDVLLRELQHRMKNNLQIILSMIAAQRRKFPGGEAADALSHIADRVAAIALAQDQLSFSQRLRTVGIGAYLRALCAYMQTGRDDIVIEAKAEDADVAIDQAVPAGLIVNEAVTNAIKHAFPPPRGGTIRVVFGCDHAARAGALLITDDGVGIKGARPGGSGLDLMQALAQQLGGSFACAPQPEGGTAIAITFPLRL